MSFKKRKVGIQRTTGAKSKPVKIAKATMIRKPLTPAKDRTTTYRILVQDDPAGLPNERMKRRTVEIQLRVTKQNFSHD
jgi:hypothetical protein